MEQIAGLVSLLGVILIARPVTLFSKSEANTVAAGDSDTIPAMNGTQHAGGAYSLDDVTPAQRLSAVGVAMVGVGGAAVCIFINYANQTVQLTCKSLSVHIPPSVGSVNEPIRSSPSTILRPGAR